MTDEPSPAPAPPEQPGWRARDGWACFLGYFGAQILVGLVIGFAIGILAAVRHRDAEEAMLAGMPVLLIVTTLGGAAAAWGIARIRLKGPVFRRGRQALGLFPVGKRPVARATLWGGMLALLAMFLLPLLGPVEPDELERVARSGPTGRVTVLVLAIFLAPPIEEFVFRGALYGGLARRHGPRWAAVIVTVLFVLLHAHLLFSAWQGLIAIALLGVITVRFRMRTGSILPALAAHACYNALITMPLFQ